MHHPPFLVYLFWSIWIFLLIGGFFIPAPTTRPWYWPAGHGVNMVLFGLLGYGIFGNPFAQ